VGAARFCVFFSRRLRGETRSAMRNDAITLDQLRVGA
jgi:hypothetical protein